MKTLLVLHAQMSAPYLAGKAFLPLAGAPLLERMVQRVLSAHSDFQLVICTTTQPEDDPIHELSRRMDVKCIGGDPTDPLDRQFSAMCDERADRVAALSIDCPLIDPLIIDRVLTFAGDAGAGLDYVSNLHPPSYPAGNDVEVVTADSLEAAWKESRKPFQREHITPFIWDQPGRFRIGNVKWETGADYSMSHRWLVEHPEDYTFARAVYDELWTVRNPIFTMNDILELTGRRQDLFAINSHLAGVNWYYNHVDELKTIAPGQTRAPLDSTLP